MCVFKKKILFCGPFGHLSSDGDLTLLLSSVELVTRVVAGARVVIVEDVLTTPLLVLLNTDVVPFDM